jgi:hypothetical protein
MINADNSKKRACRGQRASLGECCQVRVETIRTNPARYDSSRTPPGSKTPRTIWRKLLAVITSGSYPRDMPAPGDRSAREAIEDFIRHLTDRQFTDTTRRIRRHYLDEYLQHAQEATGTIDIAVGELMDPARTDAWLCDSAAGRTRTRNTLYGPDAAAYSNSMRVRIDSYNAFAEFLCLSDRHESQRPSWGYYLSPADTKRLLHDLAVRRPVHANVATSLRTAAVAALVADTSRTVPELARLKVSALHLDGEPRVELTDGFCPLGDSTVQILTRWLAARAAIIAELQGSDPGHLWIPTKPGRPRGGQPPVKPGLTPAAVRTLHAAHRSLVSRVLGTPLRPGAFRASGPSRARSSQGS